MIAQEVKAHGGDIPLTRTQSRAASVHESMYSNRVSFIRRAARKVGFGGRVTMSGEWLNAFFYLMISVLIVSSLGEELRRFSSIQAAQTGQTLARHPSRTQ